MLYKNKSTFQNDTFKNCSYTLGVCFKCRYMSVTQAKIIHHHQC